MFITGENISFRYTRDKSVLDGVSFALHKSHTLSIVGASGCGKSTLLRILSGILPDTRDNHLSGKISINGQTPDEYRRSGKLAFMFQESTLMPNLTVRQNITLPLKIKDIKDDEKVNSLLRTVGLADYANYLPKHLSGGMKTRVALARSFATGPELLLLDEPFSALDIAWKSNLYIELEKLREQYHTTVVFVTHDVQESLLLSNQIMVMSRLGQIKESHMVESSKSLIDRVYDIPGFMNEVYADYLIPIQSSIMSDGYRDAVSYRGELETPEALTKTPENKLKDEKANALHSA
jgi:ABC-type nitrate/sulfonate/bicarbonate transport system ATPase subunit